MDEQSVEHRGVDRHKTQFTVCGLKADGEILHKGIYPCTHEGYDAFSSWTHEAQEKYGLSAVLAIEATGQVTLVILKTLWKTKVLESKSSTR